MGVPVEHPTAISCASASEFRVVESPSETLVSAVCLCVVGRLIREGDIADD